MSLQIGIVVGPQLALAVDLAGHRPGTDDRLSQRYRFLQYTVPNKPMEGVGGHDIHFAPKKVFEILPQGNLIEQGAVRVQ